MNHLTLDEIAMGGVAIELDHFLRGNIRNVSEKTINVAGCLDSISSSLPGVIKLDPRETEYLLQLPNAIAGVIGLEGEYLSVSQVVASAIYQHFETRRLNNPSKSSKKGRIFSKEKIIDGISNLSNRGLSVDDIVKMDSLFYGLFAYASNKDTIQLRDSFFKDRGFSDSQIRGMYLRLPQILGYSIPRMANIQEAAEKITEKAVERERLLEVISLYPKIYGCKLYQKIVPRLLWAVEQKPKKFEGDGFLRELLILSAKDNHLTFREHFEIDLETWNTYIERSIKTADYMPKTE